MPFDTLEQYEEEAKIRKGGIRGAVGRVLMFGGFIVLANSFIVAILFRHALSFRTEMILSLTGAVVAVAGMFLAGTTGTLVETAIIGVVAAIVAQVLMELLRDAIGFWGMAAILLAGCFLIFKLEERSWRKL
jgi:hypothetical protein